MVTAEICCVFCSAGHRSYCICIMLRRARMIRHRPTPISRHHQAAVGPSRVKLILTRTFGQTWSDPLASCREQLPPLAPLSLIDIRSVPLKFLQYQNLDASPLSGAARSMLLDQCDPHALARTNSFAARRRVPRDPIVRRKRLSFFSLCLCLPLCLAFASLFLPFELSSLLVTVMRRMVMVENDEARSACYIVSPFPAWTSSRATPPDGR